MVRVLLRCLASLALVAAFPCQAFDIAHLMEELGQRKQGHARFAETKYIAVLDAPLHASGELFFQAPDTLEKKTLLPKPELIALEGNTITLERDGKKRRFNIDRYPQVSAFVGAIRGLLTGNQRDIEKSYEAQLKGDSSAWVLTLLPNDQKLAETIRKVSVSGAKGEVKTIEYVQTDGDRSVMDIEPVGDK